MGERAKLPLRPQPPPSAGITTLALPQLIRNQSLIGAGAGGGEKVGDGFFRWFLAVAQFRGDGIKSYLEDEKS